MTFQRQISPIERLYLSGEKLSPPFALQIFVAGDGEIDVERLKEAVALASDMCPGARLVQKGRTWVDCGQPPPVRVILNGKHTLGHHWQGSSFNEVPEVWEPLSTRCEVIVFPGMLVFRVSHSVMDGRGALLWIRDIFRALRGEPLLGAKSDETDQNLLNRLGFTRRPRVDFEYSSPFGSTKLHPTQFFWKRRVLYGRHPGLVAKLGEIISREAAVPLRLMVPVDLRRHESQAVTLSTANLSMPIFLDTTPSDSWEILQERLLDALAKKSEVSTDGSERLTCLLPEIGLTAMMKLAVRIQQTKGKYLLASAIISHLGKVQLADFTCPGFAAQTLYSLPVHALLSPLSLVAVECNDHVELVVACARGEGIEERVEALLDKCVRLLSEGQSSTQDCAWASNQTEALYPLDKTFTQLFKERVAEAPEAVALVRGEVELTYGALDRRSDAVAHELVARGIGRGALVGLLADRTEDAVAALLGVLKAGAAYVPIDPDYPDERIHFMLEETTIILAQRDYVHRAQESRLTREVLILDSIDESTLQQAFKLQGEPLDRAYVIFTSGSTGRPKGVQIEHRALVNYVHWAIGAYGVNSETRFALFTSLAFDLSVTSLLVPLAAGGCVALFPGALDHTMLTRILKESGVNALKLTPTHLALMSRLEIVPDGFRVVVVGGEQLKVDLAMRVQRAFGPKCRIVNEYGPTEATVGCVFQVFDERFEDDAAVPIGSPINNMRVYLLDAERCSVPRGEVGELYIVGDGLARGYLGREDLDQARFVRLVTGERAYRTGDLGCIREDGLMVYLGRTDAQIKIRGHRVEPGELEVVLEDHPNITHAVVLGHARADGDKILAAYVVGSVSEEDVRNYAEKRLPSALVPTFVAILDHIPLTVNGKVDFAQLPVPSYTRHGVDVLEIEKSEDSIEAAVLEIWGSLLEIDPRTLTPNSDFNALGGDSLTMVQMLASVAKLVGADREALFMNRVRPILRKPTLKNVSQVANEVLTCEVGR